MEQLARERARRRTYDFTRYVSPWWRPAPFHKLICDTLDRVASGETRRLIISIPAQHGKSELVSVHFPARYLGRHPDRRVIHASYGADLSNKFSRRVRRLVREDESYHLLFPDVTVSAESQNVTAWDLAHPNRGGFLSVGVGGGLTGNPAGLAIVDDPIKGAKEAYSDVIRQSVDDWWRYELLTRINPDFGSIVLFHTRWHTDDLAGRVLARDDGHEWHTLVLPGIAKENDPLGRQPGQALWPEWGFDEAWHARQKAAMGSVAYSAIYDQEPVGLEGNLFKTEWFEERWQQLPKTIENVWTAWDTAIEDDEDADEWAGVTLAQGRDGMLYVLNVRHGRWGITDAIPQIVDVAKRMRSQYGDKYRIYVEKKASGSDVIRTMARDNPVLPVVPLEVDSGKVARAMGIAGFCEARRVRFPGRPIKWIDDTLYQLAKFPAVANDDIVDAFVYAVKVGKDSWNNDPAPVDNDEWEPMAW